jgi:hypothetical protein
VFVLVCLNLVVQPCAMALGSVEDHDCPRCPPSHTGERSKHGMHGHEMGRHDMAGHDMAPSEMPCATGATDCSLADEFNYDGRAVKLELKDSPNDLPIAIHPQAALVRTMQPAKHVGWHRTRSPPPGPSAPLNVIYCVYLK